MTDIDLQESLTVDEKIELAKLEEKIHDGFKAFYEAGQALAFISEKRLYRGTHATFEEYCIDRWNLKRGRAYQLIEASEVFADLSTNGRQILPTNERQIRPLTHLPAEQRSEAWARSVDLAGGKTPSSTIVEQVVQDMQPPPLLTPKDVSVPPNPTNADVIDGYSSLLTPQPLRSIPVIGEYQEVEFQPDMERSPQYRAKPQSPALPKKQFTCIVADPPWHYDLRADDETHRNRIDYPSMSIDEILALPILDLCGKDGAVLWLWFTNNHMIEAAQCIQHWGFTLKTILTWEKVTQAGNVAIGTGHWLRNATEHCALAVRGNVGSFRHIGTLTNQSSVIRAPRREHSRKPDEFYQLVEQLCPESTKLELFARQSRPGWEAWGNDVGKFDSD